MTWVPNLFQEDCNGSGFRQFPFLVTEESIGFGPLSLCVFVRGFQALDIWWVDTFVVHMKSTSPHTAACEKITCKMTIKRCNARR